MLVYGADGHLLLDYDHEGEGPGEIGSIHRAGFTDDGRIWVLDSGIKVHWLDAASYEYLGLQRLDFFAADAAIHRSGVVLSGISITSREHYGFPLHYLDGKSALPLAERKEATVSLRSDDWRLLSSFDHTRERIWTVQSRQYVIQEVNLDGIVLSVRGLPLRLSRRYNKEWALDARGFRSYVTRIHCDADGYLWIVAYETIAPPGESNRRADYSQVRYVVYDPEADRVLADDSFPKSLMGGPFRGLAGISFENTVRARVGRFYLVPEEDRRP